jgi:transposase
VPPIPEGYGYTWFCEHFGAYQRRAHPTFRHRHDAGAVMQTDYAGQTVEVIDPKTGEIRQAQIFVAVLSASSLTFACASFSQRLPDWIEGQTKALAYFYDTTILPTRRKPRDKGKVEPSGRRAHWTCFRWSAPKILEPRSARP